MKTNPTQPSPVLNPRAVSARLHQLKKSIHRTISLRWGGTLPEVLIRRAMEEATEAAEVTGFPLLVFPLLAEEIVERVQHVIPDEESYRAKESLALAHCA
jgi:hypothetical protein